MREWGPKQAGEMWGRVKMMATSSVTAVRDKLLHLQVVDQLADANQNALFGDEHFLYSVRIMRLGVMEMFALVR